MKTPAYIFCLITLPAIVLGGCSGNDPSDPPADIAAGREIRFAASTDLSRADQTVNTLKSFNVYAYTGNATNPKIFMDNVTVTKNATNVWTYSPVEYWPASGSLDFYAYAPDAWIGSASPIAPVSYDNSEGLTDILYAVSTDLSGNNGTPNAQVLFNFRHALAKVTVKLSSTNTELKVRVTNVALANIATKGNFHFPGVSTTGPITDTNVGKWNDQNTPSTYIYHMSQAADDVIELTSTPNDLSSPDGEWGGPKYLLPQTLIWENKGSASDTYLTVMCSVYDAKTGTKLWPNSNTPKENIVEGSTFGDGLLKFPLSTTAFTEWQPGAHYVYNVVINSNDEMGAIQFGDPTVDTFVSVDTNYQ